MRSNAQFVADQTEVWQTKDFKCIIRLSLNMLFAFQNHRLGELTRVSRFFAFHIAQSRHGDTSAMAKN